MLSKQFDSSECGYEKKISLKHEIWKKGLLETGSTHCTPSDQTSPCNGTSTNNLLHESFLNDTNPQISLESAPIDIIDTVTDGQVITVTNICTFLYNWQIICFHIYLLNAFEYIFNSKYSNYINLSTFYLISSYSKKISR